MKTSCFFTYQGPGRISIARLEPRGMKKGYRRYSALAPRREMLKMPYDEYLPLYLEILGRLDPQEVWDELHRLAEPHEPVLLCWERRPLFTTEEGGGNWCHRRMIAEWLEDKLGMSVPEIAPLS